MFFQIASDFHIEKEDNDNVDINKYKKTNLSVPYISWRHRITV